jgi:hypothetical protein
MKILTRLGNTQKIYKISAENILKSLPLPSQKSSLRIFPIIIVDLCGSPELVEGR